MSSILPRRQTKFDVVLASVWRYDGVWTFNQRWRSQGFDR